MNKPQEFTSPVNHQISGRERLLKALAHQEPDRMPIDLGSTQVTGIHAIAYHRLRQVLGLSPAEAQICDHIQGLALPDTDVIERLGVEILNPVHVRATGMEPVALKRDFGDALVFWGGGVDTQGVLPNGTPQEVKDDVRRNIEALAPGGGFVCNTVHNIQPDVHAENLAALYGALADPGSTRNETLWHTIQKPALQS